MSSPPWPGLRQEKTELWLCAQSTQAWTHCCSTEEARPGPKWSGRDWIRCASRWGPTFPYLFRYTHTDTPIIAGMLLAKTIHDKEWNISLFRKRSETLGVPVGACKAALGMVALSSGIELVSGSGVLLLGEVGIGLGPNRGFLYMQINTVRRNLHK